MSESITHEIDLRPPWRRWAWGDGTITVRSRTIVLAGSAALFAMILFALTGSGEDDRPRSPANAARAIASAPKNRAPKIEPPTPAAVESPIVIQATREPDAAPEPKADAKADANPDPKPSISATEPGTLKINSEPSVWVYEGDARLGRTPLETKLAPGRHDLRYVDKAKDLEVKTKVEIRPGQTHTRDLNFGVGTLRIEAPDGTKAFIGTRLVGTAPFSKIELFEGKHHLKLKRGSEVVDEWLDVPAARVIDYRVRFAGE